MKCNKNGDRHRKANVRSRGEQDQFKKKKLVQVIKYL
jgi:hypothetical protein